jgi:predicted transcriptional regulator
LVSVGLLHHVRITYDADMRTTIDLPPAVHRRARELAKSRGQSLSSVVAELAIRGLSQLDQPLVITTNPTSGFPEISVGRTVTGEDVAEMLDEE